MTFSSISHVVNTSMHAYSCRVTASKKTPSDARYFTWVSMLSASRSSIRIGRSCCWKTGAVIISCRDRQVHVASFAQPVRTPVTFASQTNRRLFQWTCHASKVKSMPEKQLKGKEEAAEAGEDDPAANDHYDKVAGAYVVTLKDIWIASGASLCKCLVIRCVCLIESCKVDWHCCSRYTGSLHQDVWNALCRNIGERLC